MRVNLGHFGFSDLGIGRGARSGGGFVPCPGAKPGWSVGTRVISADQEVIDDLVHILHLAGLRQSLPGLLTLSAGSPRS